MLVLCREIGNSVIINGNIEVKVLSVKGKHVRLGFVAPKDIEIYRNEVINKICSDGNVFKAKDSKTKKETNIKEK